MEFRPLNGFVILEEVDEDAKTPHGLILPKSNTGFPMYRVVSLPAATEDKHYDLVEDDIVYMRREYVYDVPTPYGEVKLAQIDNIVMRHKK